MAIWFYSDFGYCNTIPSKLSDITFLDKNRPYVLPISITDISNLTGAQYNGGDPSKAYGKMREFFGSTVDAFGVSLSTVGNDPKKTFELLKLFLPSVQIVSPNLYEYMENATGPIYGCIYIKSLNRLIISNPTVDNRQGAIYSISGDSLQLLDNNLSTCIFPTMTGKGDNSIFFSVLRGYNDNIDLSNPSNYYNKLLEVRALYYKKNVFVVSLGNLNIERIVPLLFTSSSKPDGSGPDVPFPPNNPYEPGGSSGEGGGNGSFDNESDLIEDSSLPTLSSANTGFTRIYNPSLSQVQDLARYLWTDNSVIETIWNHIKQFFENPMEAIIGFNLVPVVVPNGGTKDFALMYIDTGVQMTVAASQFVDVDCGTLEVKEYYGSALDYSPNTKVSCFLPFIGNVSLNTDEVMGRTLQVKYRVDICSGSCVAKIAVDGNFIYQYSGHCAINIPLSAADFSSYVNAAISVGKLVGTALAAGAGVGLAATAQDATQQTNQVITTTQITNTVRNPATGRQITAGTQTRVETRESPMDQSSTQASFSGITPQNVSNTVGQIMTSKPHIEHSGGFSGNSGYLGVRRPYLIIERPNMCMPESFQTMNGFPSMMTVTLGDCTGFTRVQQVQLTGLSATNPEQAEILQLLKSGVIL